ncbi:hypothetical protein Q8F57_021625 [Paraburkholderia terrae]|uniref:hypothetical protein n=1 Tax=Paraburkholderia terrae TaxID=311230 RepID=UPI00296AE0BD|nr:hypothetical protein [Paraburkholderia terrae]MDW3657654.1 hypothetical protein [Paraburkholderia terrae]
MGKRQALAVLAAFFCLLFFAAAKKSRCRPAQGRRVKHANKTRMPAQRQAHNVNARTKKAKRGYQRKSESESKSKSKNKNQKIAPLSEPPAYVYNP